MEQVIDAIRAELEIFKITPSSEGGIADIVEVLSDVHFDDPIWVMVDDYPFLYVAPAPSEPLMETMGLAGYDVRTLNIEVGLVVIATDYFDPSVSEVPASRQLVQVGDRMWKWMRKFSKRKLNMSSVRKVAVSSVDYPPQIRNEMPVRMAVMQLQVDQQYQHEE